MHEMQGPVWHIHKAPSLSDMRVHTPLLNVFGCIDTESVRGVFCWNHCYENMPIKYYGVEHEQIQRLCVDCAKEYKEERRKQKEREEREKAQQTEEKPAGEGEEAQKEKEKPAEGAGEKEEK